MKDDQITEITIVKPTKTNNNTSIKTKISIRDRIEMIINNTKMKPNMFGSLKTKTIIIAILTKIITMKTEIKTIINKTLTKLGIMKAMTKINIMKTKVKINTRIKMAMIIIMEIKATKARINIIIGHISNFRTMTNIKTMTIKTRIMGTQTTANITERKNIINRIIPIIIVIKCNMITNIKNKAFLRNIKMQ